MPCDFLYTFVRLSMTTLKYTSGSLVCDGDVMCFDVCTEEIIPWAIEGGERRLMDGTDPFWFVMLLMYMSPHEFPLHTLTTYITMTMPQSAIRLMYTTMIGH